MPANSNTTGDGAKTTDYELDPEAPGSAPGTRWTSIAAIFDGGHVTFGKKGDAAVTNPATSATFMAHVKGILTHLATMITSLGNILTQVTTTATQTTTTATQTTTLAGAVQLEDAVMTDATGRVIIGIKRMDTPAASGADLDVINVNGDDFGRVRVLDTRDKTAGYPTVNKTTALATNLVVKASAGRCHQLIGYSTVSQWLQIHDASSLPADTAVPVLTFPIVAGSPFNIPLAALACTTGIVVCNSTTGPTKTIGAANTWITALYD